MLNNIKNFSALLILLVFSISAVADNVSRPGANNKMGLSKKTQEEKDNSFINKLIKGVIKYNKDIISDKVKYKNPNKDEMVIFNDLIESLKRLPQDADAETIQTEIYQIGKNHKFENLRDWFRLIYQVLFGKDDGPRFGTFVAIYGVDKTIDLINEKIGSKN